MQDKTMLRERTERFISEREDQFERAFIGIDALSGLPQYTQHPDLMKKFNRETILMLTAEFEELLTTHETAVMERHKVDLEYVLEGAKNCELWASEGNDARNIRNNIIKPLELALAALQDNKDTQ